MASSFLRFRDHTQRRTTVGRTPLYEWSARRRDLYLTTHNTQNRQTSTPPVGFEPTIAEGERPQTYALDRAATRIGKIVNMSHYKTLWQYEVSTNMTLSGFNYSVNNDHAMAVPFGSNKPTGQYRNCPINKVCHISIRVKEEAQNFTSPNVTHHFQNPTSHCDHGYVRCRSRKSVPVPFQLIFMWVNLTSCCLMEIPNEEFKILPLCKPDLLLFLFLVNATLMNMVRLTLFFF